MVYKLNIGFFPFADVFARNEEDIERVVSSLQSLPSYRGVEIAGHHDFYNFSTDLFEIVDPAVLSLDFGGMIRVGADGKPIMRRLHLTPDFKVDITLESVLAFKRYQQTFEKREVSGLYEVITRPKLFFAYFVPEDVVDSLLSFDIRVYEEQAETHMRAMHNDLCDCPGVKLGTPIKKGEYPFLN